MKVIHRAETIWVHKHSCRNCGSILEIGREDLKVHTPGFTGYEWMSNERRMVQECRDLRICIICPVCHERCDVTRYVPHNMRQLVYEGYIGGLEESLDW